MAARAPAVACEAARLPRVRVRVRVRLRLRLRRRRRLRVGLRLRLRVKVRVRVRVRIRVRVRVRVRVKVRVRVEVSGRPGKHRTCRELGLDLGFVVGLVSSVPSIATTRSPGCRSASLAASCDGGGARSQE